MPLSRESKLFFSPSRDQPIFCFAWGWVAVLGLVLTDVIGAATNVWLKLPSPWIVFSTLPFLIGLKLLYVWAAGLNIVPLRRTLSIVKKDGASDRIFLGSEFFILAKSASGAVCILTYLVCTLPYPLIDEQLHAFDRAIGFDWLAWFKWSSHYPAYLLFKTGYYSLFFQTIFFITWFSYLSDKKRLYEIFWILLLGVLTATLISGVWPAVGPVFAFNMGQPAFDHIQPLGRIIFADVTAIKTGINPDFHSHGLTGIITFPSFHTTCAVAYAYGFRHTGLIGYGIILLNIFVLMSIPSIGNHYLVDMMAGAGIAVASIFIVRIITRCRFMQYQQPS